MSRSTFRVLFYLKRNAQKKNGLVPVMCRITVKRQDFPIQLQTGYRGKVMECQSRQNVGKKHCSTRNQPNVG